MGFGSFGDYLATLDKPALVRLLRARPDVRLPPVPSGFEQLARRLSLPDSLSVALWSTNRDAVVVGQAVAALGLSATVAAIARLVGAPEPAVREAVDDLCGRGLAWLAGGVVRLPELLAEHWAAGIGEHKPALTIARMAMVDDLRATAGGLDLATFGLRKPELITAIVGALSDAKAVATVVRGLSAPERQCLTAMRKGYGGYSVSQHGYGVRGQAPGPSPVELLGAKGLLLKTYGWQLPREVAVAAWLAERDRPITGRPQLPIAEPAPAVAVAEPAVQELLRAVTALLDEAGSSSVAALKKGGVGTRERSRLAARLALPADVLTLVIDLTYAAGLLGLAAAGYAPTERYAQWRAAVPSRQWAVLATTWFGMEHAPTHRIVDGDKELPPPLPLGSAAGALRRAVLRAAVGGYSVCAAGEQVDWFFPSHGYPVVEQRVRVVAGIREAELLGVVVADRLTGCGEHLVAVVDGGGSADVVGELAGRVAEALPELACSVILQSDLTAVVSGPASVAVSEVLSAAAVRETGGAAAVWRFGPASVRAAFDAGWTSERLLAALAELSDRPVPQPLEYLVADVARRHGQVRVRGMRSCIVAEEATVVEILHTRSLAKLQLAQVAPTVLSCPFELDMVLARLRAAGLSPVAEDAFGTVIVETAPEQRAPSTGAATRLSASTQLGADELAERLLADPASASGPSQLMFDRVAQPAAR